MKRLLFIVFILIAALFANATRRALVIGIGDYPATSGWHKINGDKDIPLVEEMLMVNGFSKQNIVDLKNKQATCAAICKEFENLIAKSQLGDYIYVHFSGHGQQITDLNGDEEDGMDEAWIPYDAQLTFKEGIYEGENHLVDDQLNSYLHRLRQSIGPEGKIVVVSDACHSGSVTRYIDDDENGIIYRGTFEDFILGNVQSAVNKFTKLFKGTSTSAIDCSHIETPVPQNIEWLHISACEDKQVNQEYKGKGSLTTALYLVKDRWADLTLNQLRKHFETFYEQPQFLRIQSPQLEGPRQSVDKLF